MSSTKLRSATQNGRKFALSQQKKTPCPQACKEMEENWKLEVRGDRFELQRRKISGPNAAGIRRRGAAGHHPRGPGRAGRALLGPDLTSR